MSPASRGWEGSPWIHEWGSRVGREHRESGDDARFSGPWSRGRVSKPQREPRKHRPVTPPPGHRHSACWAGPQRPGSWAALAQNVPPHSVPPPGARDAALGSDVLPGSPSQATHACVGPAQSPNRVATGSPVPEPGCPHPAVVSPRCVPLGTGRTSSRSQRHVGASA